MERYDNLHLMMIEPKKDKSVEPIEDNVSTVAAIVLDKSTINPRHYRGFHTCVCGEISTNYDLISPMGRITNSLIVHYVRYHRDEILSNEIVKLNEEMEFLNNSILKEI